MPLMVAVFVLRTDDPISPVPQPGQKATLEARERARREQVERLVADIENSQGNEREAKLEQLLVLAPETQLFPDELPAIREKVMEREREAQAKREAERQAELERKELERKEQERQALEAKLAKFKWQYQVSKDQLTGKPTHLAWVESINQVNFGFPYQGPQRGQLMLRIHPQHGKDLILRVERGQMLVRSYESTKVKAVFDAGNPETYAVVGPADHGTTTMFFRDYDGFTARMREAKKVKISVPFYQQGSVVFEFNVSEFDADKHSAKD